MYQWWREQKDRFPLLYICFLAVFSMPGSEIEAERIFSICGILTQLRRNRMSDHMLDKLVYINKLSQFSPAPAGPYGIPSHPRAAGGG